MSVLAAPERLFEAEQFIPRPRAEVFEFFASEVNLESITPPWLNFKVLGKSTPTIGEGTLIDYQLKLYGLPLRWRTRIESWRLNEQFVDTQLRGPYAKWHHTHTFRDHNGGTMMHDLVRYRLPLGRVGDLLGQAHVRGQVAAIFAYRKQIISERWP